VILLIDALDSFTYNLVQAFESLGASVRVERFDTIDLEMGQGAGSGGRGAQPRPGPSHRVRCPHGSGGFRLGGAHARGVPGAAGPGGGHGRAGDPRPGALHGEATPIQHEGRDLFEGLPQGLSVGRYHSLIAEPDTLPSCWRIAGRSAIGEIMAIAHRSLPRWGVQFHPESILTPAGPAMVRNFLAQVATRNSHPGN